MTDARDRRRQHAEESKKADPLGAMKKYRVPIVIMIVWLAIVGYNVAASKGYVGDPASGCPGHWHAMTQVYLDDGDNMTAQLTFDPNVNPGFGASSNGFHLHDASGRIHMHPGTERCVELGDVFSYLGLDIDASGIESLKGPQGQEYNYGSFQQPLYIDDAYATNDTHELRIYELDWDYGTGSHGTEWQRVNDVNGFLKDQIGNGDKVLVTFVPKDVDPAVIKEQQDSVGFIGDSYIPGTDSIFMPVLAATMFAGVAILIWRSFANAATKA